MKTQTLEKLKFELPDLPYSTDALEPFIDQQTMEIHHGKHHAAYVSNLNKAIEEENIQEASLEEILKNISHYKSATRNNAGGHYNHLLFWNILSRKAEHVPSGALSDAISEYFGSFENFKTEFERAALNRFGSGWAWLIMQKDKLSITSTANQDNPLMDVETRRGIPILGLDVWEHAYYLKYQNRRAEYVGAFWKILNWEEVEKRFEKAKGQTID
jgi:Fe-Mn family superoxide dismutase